MSKKMLIVSTLMLTLCSVKTFGGYENLSVSSKQPSFYQHVLSIKTQQKLDWITSEEAVNHLYQLGLRLPKGANGIADIIDTLGDLGALKEGLILLEKHDL
jgi:hypothetical protein